MSDELKPCPFCGCEKITLERSCSNDCLWMECWECSTEGPVGSSSKEAKKIWNTRPREEYLEKKLRVYEHFFKEPDVAKRLEELEAVLLVCKEATQNLVECYDWDSGCIDQEYVVGCKEAFARISAVIKDKEDA